MVPWEKLEISWTAKKSNKTLLQEANTTRSLINRIYKSQATFCDHVMRRDKLEHLVTTGTIEGKRSRGKQRGWTNKVAQIRKSDRRQI